MMTTQKRRAAGTGIVGPKEMQLILVNTILYSAAFAAFMWKDFAQVFQWLTN
ncbi:MAG: hypothetical protein H7841_05990 [Magnetospirillum sp. WYHS-4]